ncbi:MAG: Tsi3 family protein [Steroidobacter sp.]
MEGWGLRKLQRSAVVTVLAMVLLGGCGDSQTPVGASHVHANGLRLIVSEDFKVTTTPSGFWVETVHVTRSPIEVSIALLTTRPKSVGYRFRYLGSGRILWYSVTHEQEGGSGGVDYTVVAFEHVGEHWIAYRQVRQSEAQPVFELWQIASGLRYVPSDVT